jgi:hypothetical protein
MAENAMPKPVPLMRKKAMMKMLRAWTPFHPPSSRSIHLHSNKQRHAVMFNLIAQFERDKTIKRGHLRVLVC